MSRPPDLNGALLGGRYRLGEWLGGGGMGDVYLGEHVGTGRRFAIKILNDRYRGRPRSHERFRREALAASRIAHDNIVGIIDFDSEADGRHYLVMELLRGESLDVTLEREGRLPWPAVRSIALQLADALAVAHALGIVHRDLKPANCFRTQLGDDHYFVKILDFGLAKLRAAEFEGERDITSTGALLGTLRYMAPEQAHDSANVDHRADIYALAVIVYKLLTGSTPVRGESELNFLYNLIHTPARRLAEAAPDLAFTPGLEEALARALAKHPEDRFESADAFAAALRALDPEPWSSPIEDDPRASLIEAAASAPPSAAETTAPGSSRGVEHLLWRISTRAAFYVDPGSRWSDEVYEIGGLRLVIARADIVLDAVDAVACELDRGGPAAGSSVRRICEFAGPSMTAGLVPLRPPLDAGVHLVRGGRLAATDVLLVVFAPARDPAVDSRERLTEAVAATLTLASRRVHRRVALPIFAPADLGLDRQQAFVRLAEAIIDYAVHEPQSALHEIRLLIDDGGDAVAAAGGQAILDLTGSDVPEGDRIQRFVLGRYPRMRDLGDALWSALPQRIRPERASYGTLWLLYHVQAGRSLSADILFTDTRSPTEAGLLNGAVLRLIVRE